MLRRRPREVIYKRTFCPTVIYTDKGVYNVIEDEDSWKFKLRTFLRRVGFLPSQKAGFSITSLNDSLLTEIYQYPPLVDKVCLSLTCKKLFQLFGAVSKDSQFAFPRLLYIRVPILCINSKDVSRNQLLVQLENRRWAYCGDCLKLHPREVFTTSALRGPSMQRQCSRFAGTVDLCACNCIDPSPKGSYC